MFNEVFLTEARVADDALIGGAGEGWAVTNTTLMHERATLGAGGGSAAASAATPGTVLGHLERRAGDFISEHTGGAPDASTTLIPKPVADAAMDAAACIGCGACAAACPNSSPMLFVGAKVTHLGLLPQGQAERKKRARNMVRTMQEEGFGNCSNYYACEAVCPANVSASVIARLNRDYIAGEVSEAVGAID
jgi:alkylation response protein AidB-like acyl-CoA dehydrogenase